MANRLMSSSSMRMMPFALAWMAIAMTTFAQSPVATGVSVKAALEAATAYVEAYEPKFSYLLADEDFTQHVFDSAGSETAKRVTKGEFFLTYLPVQRAWMAVRDVAEVDGVVVPNRPDLGGLLKSAPLYQLAAVLASQNARFNIGRIDRNFAEPTLALAIVERGTRDRFKFAVIHVETLSDATVVTLSFKERDRP